MTPINPVELRGMLRDDAVSLALGGLLLIAGVLAIAVAAIFRRRATPLLWLAVFAHLYGLRLLIRTSTFGLYSESTVAWDYTEAAITYAIPIPIVLCARALFPASRRFWSWGALGLTAFAAYGIASDAILQQPSSAENVNSLIAIAFFVGVLAWMLRPRLVRSREVQTMRLGALAVSLTAVADNLRGMGIVAFRGPELEPFGCTVLIACLGAVAARRVIADGERLVAINRELEIAQRIQSAILPQTMPRIAGLTIATRYRPVTAVAGDFYDFVEVDASRLGILVADVTGHGVPAALIASMVKVALAAQYAHADRPAMVLAGMNEILGGRLAGKYVTAAYLFIDTESRLFRYAAAGHPPMLRVEPAERHVIEVEHNGLMLGFLQDQHYSEIEGALGDADRFLLYSDGLIEAANGDDDFFGLERVKRMLNGGGMLDAEPLAESLLTTVEQWAGPAVGDDVTLVVADWVDPGPRDKM